MSSIGREGGKELLGLRYLSEKLEYVHYQTNYYIGFFNQYIFKLFNRDANIDQVIEDVRHHVYAQHQEFNQIVIDACQEENLDSNNSIIQAQ